MIDADSVREEMRRLAAAQTDRGSVGHAAGWVQIAVGKVAWSVEPSVARHMAKALRKCADEADRYRRKIDKAALSAVPIRTTENGAATLHAVPE